MLTKLKNLSFITKLLYLLALITLAIWLVPQMQKYYSNVNTYQKNLKELTELSSQQGVALDTQKFSKELFKKNTESLFSKMTIDNIDSHTYIVHMNMKKEALKSFHTLLETISLKYYVQLEGGLEFKAEDDIINITMILKEL